MAPAHFEMVRPMTRPIPTHAKASRGRALRRVDPPLGTAHDDAMENRIASLEHHAAETRDRLIRIETTLEHTATAESVAALEVRLAARLETGLGAVKSELRQEIAEIKVELLTAMGSVRSDMGNMRSDMGNMRSDLFKWSATMLLAVATLAFSAARFIH
jgi:hypothetical protein